MTDNCRITWSGLSCNVLSNIQKLRRNHLLCDCKLVVDGQIFLAHKLILASASILLRYLLQDETSENATIILVGVHADDVAALLDYIYTGAVNVYANQLSSLLMLAKSLGISSLMSDGPSTTAFEDNVMESAAILPADNKILSEDLPIDVPDYNYYGLQLRPAFGKGQRIKKRSEEPALCPYCHIVIRQQKNLLRHFNTKHNPNRKNTKKDSANAKGSQDSMKMMEEEADSNL